MANKTRKYRVSFFWKEEGNRGTAHVWDTTATTIQRAVSKTVKDINEGKCAVDVPQALGEEEIRASDLLVVDVRTPEFTETFPA